MRSQRKWRRCWESKTPLTPACASLKVCRRKTPEYRLFCPFVTEVIFIVFFSKISPSVTHQQEAPKTHRAPGFVPVCSSAALYLESLSHVCLFVAGNCLVVEDFELQRQVVCALNSVLYEQLQYKGNEFDYYNPLNSYIHQVDPQRHSVFLRSETFPPLSSALTVWLLFRCYYAVQAFPSASLFSTWH